MKPIVLAAHDRKLRGELARYLEDAGFAITEHDAPPRPDRRASLVWLTLPDTDPAEITATATAWIGLPSTRVVVVTSRPALLRELADAHGARLVVLPAPVFAWQLSDALRAGPPKSA